MGFAAVLQEAGPYWRRGSQEAPADCWRVVAQRTLGVGCLVVAAAGVVASSWVGCQREVGRGEEHPSSEEEACQREDLGVDLMGVACSQQVGRLEGEGVEHPSSVEEACQREVPSSYHLVAYQEEDQNLPLGVDQEEG